MLAAFHLADTPRRAGPWLALTVAALIGTSIRFEFWLALPLVTLHHLARIRSLARTALVALAMAPFPALWLAERASQGGLAAAYADAISGAAYVGAHSVDLVTGAANAAATLVALMGGPLVWLGLLGLATLPLRLHRPGPWPDRALPLALLALETLFLAKFAADRGAALWPRYLATELVLLLPFAAGALAVCVRPAAVRAAATALALAAACYATWARAPDLYLVRAIPEATREAAAWIAERPRRRGVPHDPDELAGELRPGAGPPAAASATACSRTGCPRPTCATSSAPATPPTSSPVPTTRGCSSGSAAKAA